MELRLGLGQVGVLGGLRLRAGEVLAQGAGQVAHLHQHAVFPVGHVVQPQPRRREVVGQVAARLVEQTGGDGLQGFHRGVAGHHLDLGLFCRGLGLLLHREQFGLEAPVPADHQRTEQVDADHATDRPAGPDPAEVAARAFHRVIDTVAHGADLFLPIQHGLAP
ncbi:hypothetical protein D3C78_749300 [compost metagenome]